MELSRNELPVRAYLKGMDFHRKIESMPFLLPEQCMREG
ncbi:hypothetical protein SynROS8604_03640 [Synechococcus sp. ROS8604]|nr:hypothetical protein SynROS8604_03640 [Synechococcus sp. ROS8604]